jgi:hypothetical protein
MGELLFSPPSCGGSECEEKGHCEGAHVAGLYNIFIVRDGKRLISYFLLGVWDKLGARL